MVPRLTTAFSGPLLEIERRVLDAMPEIERWLRGQWQEHTPPFYGSTDLRNSGFKLAPVDMNLCSRAASTISTPRLPAALRPGGA
jgi:glutamate--cysteine ligase